MNDVEANLQCIITANGAGDGFGSIRGTHGRAYHTNDLRTFNHAYNHWTRGDMFYQAGIKGLPFMDPIVFFSQFWRYLDEFEAYQLEAALLKTRDDFPDQATLDPLGFHNDQCTFHKIP